MAKITADVFTGLKQRVQRCKAAVGRLTTLLWRTGRSHTHTYCTLTYNRRKRERKLFHIQSPTHTCIYKKGKCRTITQLLLCHSCLWILLYSSAIRPNQSTVFADIHKSIKLSTSSAFTGRMPAENTLLFQHNSRKGLIPQLIQTEQRQTHGGPEERRTLSLLSATL